MFIYTPEHIVTGLILVGIGAYLMYHFVKAMATWAAAKARRRLHGIIRGGPTVRSGLGGPVTIREGKV